MDPVSIRLFLVSGDPAGLRTAEIGLSTCKAVACPRASLAKLREREEARRTGVYVLLGRDAEDGVRVYVGEGDEVLDRIITHDRQKDFWDTLVFFVSKDENLTKAHVRYLEARLIADARAARRASVDNGTSPESGRLPEADRAEMETFLRQVRLLLGALGITVFEPALGGSDGESVRGTRGSELHLAQKGVKARGVVTQTGFVVLAGSEVQQEAKASLSISLVDLRTRLQRQGVLGTKAGKLIFLADYEFSSPSAAAAVIAGTAINGRSAWKLADGTTLKDLEERALLG